jgi:DmsA/YnfE family anaerobic dimethyl sulfoxide reductase A subunit
MSKRTGGKGMPRREFLQQSAAVAALAAVGTPALPITQALAQAAGGGETVTWTSCVVNCGSRCPMRVVSKAGKVIRMEPEFDVADSCTLPQARACQRGRSMRARLYSKERLQYPMKRVGKRGEGKFQRISWDEALDTVAKSLKDTIAKYGNDAVFLHYGSGNQAMVSNLAAAARLLRMLGGYLNYHGSYSNAQKQTAWPYTYGEFLSGGLGNGSGSLAFQIANAKLYVAFGNNQMVTRSSGIGQSWELACAFNEGKVRTIRIDPIYSDSMLGKEDEWVPIRPGTDAALVEGIAHVLITENMVDQDFLDKYCVGYDEKTLPAGAPKNSDYKSYILGKGPDGVAKSPAWAAKICGVPAANIVRLAREIGGTRPVFISQGWSNQRQANGEQTCRAIAMLPILTGNIGLPGTNSGAWEGDVRLGETNLPAPANPVKAVIPVFMWTDAITRGAEMTAKRDGVRGVDQLKQPIKFMWVQQSNTLVNQHSDINKTHKVLVDDKKCEFIVVIDNQMTPSARYADILLPATMMMESPDVAADGYVAGRYTYMMPMHKAVEPVGEAKSNYDICRELSKRFGIEDKFTEGRSLEQWIEWCYEATRKKYPSLPPFAEFWQKGLTRIDYKGDGIVLKGFREDPVKNKLKTPSGKIEIYSERLAKIAAEWELTKGDVITPLPQYVTTWESHKDPQTKKYPLQAFGYHGHGRTHSTYHNIPWLREAHPDEVMINPIDAGKRKLKTGDKVKVFNDRGAMILPVKVTPRIMPGVVALPQGAWYKPRPDGVDEGACINILTSQRPSPLAKGNPQHTNLVDVRKA